MSEQSENAANQNTVPQSRLIETLGTELSDAATRIIKFILLQLSGCKYGYRTIVAGCYDAAIYNYGFVAPSEPKEQIIDIATGMLRT